ncbi:MAG: hypothetical protein H8D94_01220 [Candidatus Pelagibacter sp.]|nr:hypothetical protein [Candidatus Pelagibacter sp.]
MVNTKTKYHKGDEVIINKRKWLVENVRTRFGLLEVYELNRIKQNGKSETLTIETGSLEKIMG